MRTMHELLILLRDNIKVTKSWFGLRQRIGRGLCLEIGLLYSSCDDLINNEEYCLLCSYINDNRPFYEKDDSYGWKPTLWKPRLKWLNKHIERTRKIN